MVSRSLLFIKKEINLSIKLPQYKRHSKSSSVFDKCLVTTTHRNLKNLVWGAGGGKRQQLWLVSGREAACSLSWLGVGDWLLIAAPFSWWCSSLLLAAETGMVVGSQEQWQASEPWPGAVELLGGRE